MTKSNEYIDPCRRDLAADPHRPLYHFLAPANYMGDPNGMIFWRGKDHLFDQYNPDGAYDQSSRMHWGHAISENLLHWHDLPIALTPILDGSDCSHTPIYKGWSSEGAGDGYLTDGASLVLC